MTKFPDPPVWRSACADDAVLAAWAGPWSLCFAVQSGDAANVFVLAEGRVQSDEGLPAFTLRAPEGIWAKFLEPLPPRHHHGIFAMLYRVPEFAIDGDRLCFMQHAHVARRVLEIGKWLALGNATPVPVLLQPRTGNGSSPRLAAAMCR